jgi:hypothetical protein
MYTGFPVLTQQKANHELDRLRSGKPHTGTPAPGRLCGRCEFASPGAPARIRADFWRKKIFSSSLLAGGGFDRTRTHQTNHGDENA